MRTTNGSNINVQLRRLIDQCRRSIKECRTVLAIWREGHPESRIRFSGIEDSYTGPTRPKWSRLDSLDFQSILMRNATCYLPLGASVSATAGSHQAVTCRRSAVQKDACIVRTRTKLNTLSLRSSSKVGRNVYAFSDVAPCNPT
jgi:hypothetical protein